MQMEDKKILEEQKAPDGIPLPKRVQPESKLKQNKNIAIYEDPIVHQPDVGKQGLDILVPRLHILYNGKKKYFYAYPDSDGWLNLPIARLRGNYAFSGDKLHHEVPIEKQAQIIGLRRGSNYHTIDEISSALDIDVG